MDIARMLLPSPLPCDSSSSSSPSTPLNNLYATCRTLQSILAPSPFPTQLPSPPTSHTDIPAPLSPSPFRLRLRARKTDTSDVSSPALTPRKKITKRGNGQQAKVAPPRGINKRRRGSDDDTNRASILRQTPEQEEQQDEQKQSTNEWDEPSYQEEDEQSRPRTPKRMRLAPEVLPLGLERGDFHNLHLLERLRDTDGVPENPHDEDQEGEEANEEWSTEEDRILVELVLEKLKLTKSDWQDCARSLGKDRGNVGRRWKSLMGAGEIGLKQRPMRRAKLHGTWR